MTNVCPRCRAPLTGPVCTACGAPAPVSAWGQPPPGMYYGHMPPYGYGGYQMMPVPMQPPKKTFAVVGGITSLCACGLVLLLLAVGYGNHDFRREDGVPEIIAFTLALTAAAGLFSVFSILGKWWGALVAGILQSVNTLMTLALCGGAQEAKEKAMFDSFYIDHRRGDELETLTTLYAFSALGVMLAAIFLYIGISGAKRLAQNKRHLQATETF
jgi:hypothetical protein